MNGLTLFAEAWRALRANRLRTGLTMLGIIIGVGAVVLMLAVGKGAQFMVNQAIASMGSNLFIVTSGASTSGGMRLSLGSAPTLTLDDAKALAQLPDIAQVSPAMPGTAQLVYGPNNWSTTVFGTTPNYFVVRSWPIIAGTAFNDADVRAAGRSVVLGQTVIRQLFGDETPVGKVIRINKNPYTVIGALTPKGQSLDGRDQDDVAIIPISTAQRKLFGNQFPGMVRFLFVQTATLEAMERAEGAITALLRERHRIRPNQEDDFAARNLTALAQTAAVAARVMSLMLGSIASVSLLVGGIGIMNIMLVSVVERTREIGIRMAVGAKARHILLQFVIEAVIIAFIGCLLGALLGIGCAWLAVRLFEITAVVTLTSILLAFAVASAIGLFFGIYPASKAARLNPIDALRYQ